MFLLYEYSRYAVNSWATFPGCFQIISRDCYTCVITGHIFFKLHVSLLQKILYNLYLLGTHIVAIYKPVISRSIIVGNKSIFKIVSTFSASKLF